MGEQVGQPANTRQETNNPKLMHIQRLSEVGQSPCHDQTQTSAEHSQETSERVVWDAAGTAWNETDGADVHRTNGHCT
jgi:hypothetical protein